MGLIWPFLIHRSEPAAPRLWPSALRLVPEAESQPSLPAKVSTDITWWENDRSGSERPSPLARVILRGVNAGLSHTHKERRCCASCCPSRACFVEPDLHTAALNKVPLGKGFSPVAQRLDPQR